MNLNRPKEITFVVCIFIGILFDPAIATLKISIESEVKSVNETFIVVCKDDTGRNVKWTSPKGNVLGLKTHPTVSTAIYGSVLKFNMTKVEDTGIYTCSTDKEKKHFHLTVEENYDNPRVTPTHAINNKRHPYHNKSHNKHIKTITEELVFKDTKDIQQTVEGDEYLIRCEVTRGGQIRWTWPSGEEVTGPRYTVIGDGLVIKNVSRHDSKTYICSAIQTSTGRIYEKRIKLVVNHKPVFLHYAEQETVFGYVGGTTKLTCEVSAEPAPTFVWTDPRRKRIQATVVSSHLTVLQIKVTEHSFGDYNCTVTNKLGKLEKIFTLEEGSKPDPPNSLQLLEAHSDTLDLEILLPELPEDREEIMDPKWFVVEYKDLTKEDWYMQEFNKTEDNTYPLIGLIPDTDYEVKAASKNLAGLSEFTNSSIFKTDSSAASVIYNPFVPLYLFIYYFCILANN